MVVGLQKKQFFTLCCIFLLVSIFVQPVVAVTGDEIKGTYAAHLVRLAKYANDIDYTIHCGDARILNRADKITQIQGFPSDPAICTLVTPSQHKAIAFSMDNTAEPSAVIAHLLQYNNPSITENTNILRETRINTNACNAGPEHRQGDVVHCAGAISSSHPYPIELYYLWGEPYSTYFLTFNVVGVVNFQEPSVFGQVFEFFKSLLGFGSQEAFVPDEVLRSFHEGYFSKITPANGEPRIIQGFYYSPAGSSYLSAKILFTNFATDIRLYIPNADSYVLGSNNKQLVTFNPGLTQAQWRALTASLRLQPSNAQPLSGEECDFGELSIDGDCTNNILPDRHCAGGVSNGCRVDGDTQSGENASAYCDANAGYTGTCSGICVDGTWTQGVNRCIREDIDCGHGIYQGCQAISTTPNGTRTVGTCIDGYVGTCAGSCNEGAWEDVIYSCILQEEGGEKCPAGEVSGCRYDVAFPGSPGASHVVGRCFGEYQGTCTLTCGFEGWTSIENNCVLGDASTGSNDDSGSSDTQDPSDDSSAGGNSAPQCPAAEHQGCFVVDTDAGTNNAGSCDSSLGYSGTCSINCLDSGEWDLDSYQNNCALGCQAGNDGAGCNLPGADHSPTEVSGQCGGEYTGSCTGVCTNGEWSVTQACTPQPTGPLCQGATVEGCTVPSSNTPGWISGYCLSARGEGNICGGYCDTDGWDLDTYYNTCNENFGYEYY